MIPSSPVPKDLESRDEFVARYVDEPSISYLPLPRRFKMADLAWTQAKLRSRASVKNSAGEWLMFD